MSDKKFKKIHMIIDFQYLYYRCFFGLKAGRMKKLSCEVDGEKIDTSEMYYVMSYIEASRKAFENSCEELTVSICFDSKNNKRKEDENYKANRDNKAEENKLSESDFEKIDRIRELCRSIGYNIYKKEGYEADDLVASLVKKYKDDYDYTVIYTTDKDLLINICDNVGAMRYKTSLKSHMAINKEKYSDVLSKEFKCTLPYNSIGLYLSLVGDNSDNIKGVKGFGPKAFDKFVNLLSAQGKTFDGLGDYDKVEETIKENAGLINTAKNPNAVEQALESLSLVRSLYIEVEKPIKKDTDESRKEAFHKYSIRLGD